MKIFLIGYMGSGKTTIGKRLAWQTGFDFVDTDSFIEMQQGMTISEIFAQKGEAAFREMEHKALLDLQIREFTVTSTGGGLPCHNDNMDLMLACGKVVYLKTSPQELARRLFRSHKERPLIKGKTKYELQQYIAEQLAVRETFYNRANAVLDTEKYSMEEVLNLVFND